MGMAEANATPKTVPVSMRVNEEERTWLKEAAAAEGVSISDYIRVRILPHASKRKRGNPRFGTYKRGKTKSKV